MLEIREDLLDGLDGSLRALTCADGSGYDIRAAKQEVQEVEKLATSLLSLTKENRTEEKYFEDKLAELYDKRAQLLREIDKAEQEMAEFRIKAARLQRLMASIRSAPLQHFEYSDPLPRINNKKNSMRCQKEPSLLALLALLAIGTKMYVF